MIAYFFLSCVFYKRPIHSWMAEGISKHIERCRICSSRSPLKSGLCEICERSLQAVWIPLCCEVKTTRNLCLKCQDFTEKVDSLIQTEIDFCQDCHVPMKILSDEIEFICLRCSLVREKKNLFPKNNKREVSSFKSPYFWNHITKRWAASCLIRCNINKLKIIFKVVVEFIHSPQKKIYSTKTVNYKFFLSKILQFLFQFEKTKQLQKNRAKKWNDLGQFSSISRYVELQCRQRS